MTQYTKLFASRMERIQASTIREILKLTSQPGFISFAGGLPASDLFPIAEMKAVANRILDTQGTVALQYSTTEGHVGLREWVAARLPGATVENVQITSGSQQGLDFFGKLFLEAGAKIAVEAPTYLGALSSFNPYEPDYVSIPMDDEGMIPEALEAALKAHSLRFIYLLPTFQNPSGRLMGLERRQTLVAMARKYEVPILEDDAYAELYYDGKPLPTLYALDHALGGSNVMYSSTASKTLAPGLRVAWVVAPKEVINRLVFIKQAADLHTSTFNQMMVYETVKDDAFYQAQVGRIRQTYQTRCGWMLEGLQNYMPEDMSWITPKGGMFFFLSGSPQLDSMELLKRAVEEKMAFVPGQPFFTDGTGNNTLRLSFSSASQEQMEEGIKRLGKAVHALLGREVSKTS